MKQAQQPFIFCVDDDEDDLLMLQEAIAANGCTLAVQTAADGEEALLRIKEMLQEKVLPSLIVLDVNMPRVDGREILLAIMADADLSRVPVVAYTTSTNLTDTQFFKRHNVAFYIKPSYYDELRTVAAAMLTHCQQASGSV